MDHFLIGLLPGVIMGYILARRQFKNTEKHSQQQQRRMYPDDMMELMPILSSLIDQKLQLEKQSRLQQMRLLREELSDSV